MYEFDEYGEYRTDETEVLRCTRKLEYEINNPQKYAEIFRCFVKKDIQALSDIMVSMLQNCKNYRNTVAKQNTRIEELEKRLEDQNKQLIAQRETIYKLQANISQLSSQRNKLGIEQLMRMRLLYEREKYSLNKLGEMFNCDKNTVKQRLLEMGVEIRSNSGR